MADDKGWPSKRVRDTFVSFFEERGHLNVKSSSGLLTQGDRPAPVAWRFIRIPIQSPLGLRAVGRELLGDGPIG